MRGHDEIRLRHMIEAAREAVSFARGRVRGEPGDRPPVAPFAGQGYRDRWRSRVPDNRLDS